MHSLNTSAVFYGDEVNLVAKRRRSTTQVAVTRRLKEQRGQGTGGNYVPWLHIQDVPSQGLVSRIKGWKTGRVHHLLSELETSYFYVLEWALPVLDIREQFPLLPLEETQAIAGQLDIAHPADPRTQEPVIMTTDFLITIQQGIDSIEVARSTKPAQGLQSQRTLEKLEIERCYWLKRNVDWGIVTEREIPEALVNNVKWLHPYLRTIELAPLTQMDIDRIATALSPLILQANTPLANVTTICDDKLGLAPGTSLSVVRHLLASRRWCVDMSQPIRPNEKLILSTASVISTSHEIGEVG